MASSANSVTVNSKQVITLRSFSMELFFRQEVLFMMPLKFTPFGLYSVCL
jgi:hypothetical protein